MRNSFHAAALLFSAVLLLSAAGCPEADDAFMFVNNDTTPNVKLQGGQFMLHFGVQNIAEQPVTKEVTVKMAYWQMNTQAAKNKECQPSNPGECDHLVERKETVSAQNVGGGKTWSHVMRIGRNPLGEECTQEVNCHGTATIEFTNGGDNTQTMTVRWPQTQVSSTETLEVTCCKKKN